MTSAVANRRPIGQRTRAWGRSVPKGHGLGIAVHRSFVSDIATIIEVSTNSNDTFSSI